MADVPEKIAQLVETFERNLDAYKSQYNETQLRREFIDPFFEALGWDVANKQGYAPAYKDVIHEDAIKMGGYTKAPDYCFRIGGARKFFLEAKKPSVDVKHDPHPAYQLRRYAWSAKLPLSILTDFEEFAVYDCRNRPKQTDRASVGRIIYLTYKDYVDRWDEIAGIFSKDAILKGSFDKYAVETKGKRGTSTVDQEFLLEIKRWRDWLAKNIAFRNRELSRDEINFAVQRTIDRVLFLRMCEDRGIETYSQLLSVTNGNEVYERLCAVFRQADAKYNSGLFYFHKEKGRHDAPDELTPNITVDDGQLRLILKGLYYPQCPYEFSVLPAEILGNVYEQFLGQVIELTSAHKAEIKDKPEVKKAGGVYYTPSYIVDYIVKNTVGKLCENKTPTQISQIKILDPACGSGSFLLGAYTYLLDYCRDRYVENNPEKHTKKIYQGRGGQWFLTIAEKKRILLDSVFGVDIDSQAVEVTKLSLLLKVLEGETAETVGQTYKMFHERALPDLGDNIKCGNSLIGPDFFDNPDIDSSDDELVRKTNAFDWQKEFPQIFSHKKPGFDVVIGNPPYLYSAGQDQAAYFRKTYQLSEYQTDFYVFFIEKGLSLTTIRGKFSFIVSDSWLNSQYFSKVRNHLLAHHRIERISVFDYPVFKSAALENSIFVVSCCESPDMISVDTFANPNSVKTTNTVDPATAINLGLIDPRYNRNAEELLKKIEKGSTLLDSRVKVNRGIHAYRTDGYGKSKYNDGPQTKRDKDTLSYHADSKVDETYLPEIKGKNVFRFSHVPTGTYISYGPWLAEPRTRDFFYSPKLALRKILGPKLHGTFIEQPYALDQSLYVLISCKKDISDLKFLLGVLLSRLAAWYIRTKHSIYDTLYPWYTKKHLSTFPIKTKDIRLVKLVDSSLDLHKKLSTAKVPAEKTKIQRQIDGTDRKIDKLVYELYGLTDEEIKIVEESTK
jgi:hypothetical protein